MKTLANEEFEKWAASQGVDLDLATGHLRFREFLMFRIPIGDYRLQLDSRIRAALSLLGADQGYWIRKVRPFWEFEPPVPPNASDRSAPLRAVFRAIGVPPGPGTLLFESAERPLVEALVYLVNRWADSEELGVYVLSCRDPALILYFCASTESVFVRARSREVHDDAVAHLRRLQIPAFGPSIPHPLAVVTYPDIRDGRLRVAVDRLTGKPVGPGSEESVLLPEYLPPRANS